MAATTYFTGNLRANAARGDWADAAAVWNDSASQAINCTGAPAIGAAKPALAALLRDGYIQQ